MRRKVFLASAAAVVSSITAKPAVAAPGDAEHLVDANFITRGVPPDEWNAASERVNPLRRTALVLSGGVAHGVYEAGVISSLLARGYHFDVICGTSIGALNGAFLAQGDAKGLEQIWKTAGTKPIKKFKPDAELVYEAARAAMVDGSGVWNRYAHPFLQVRTAINHGLITMMGAYDPRGAQSVLRALDLRLIKTPFIFSVTNVDLGRAEAIYAAPKGTPDPQFDPRSDIATFVLDHKNDKHIDVYAEAVRASGALPFAFDPVRLPGIVEPPEGQKAFQYSDGGVANNTPIRLARKLGATDAMCVFLHPRDQSAPPVSNLLDALLNMYSANQTQLFDDEILLALQTRDNLKADASKLRELSLVNRLLNIYEIRPAEELPVKTLDFDNQEALNAGYDIGIADGLTDPLPYDVRATNSFKFSGLLSPKLSGRLATR